MEGSDPPIQPTASDEGLEVADLSAKSRPVGSKSPPGRPPHPGYWVAIAALLVALVAGVVLASLRSSGLDRLFAGAPTARFVPTHNIQ